jgi:hypothetical protein
MNARFRSLAVAALLTATGAPAVALAQVDVSVRVPVPSIRFEVRPPLVVVSPGVQVVEDYDEEVFFVDRYYYVREGDHWYRTRDHRGHWVRVEPRYVPVSLVRAPRGKYRRYHRTEVREVRVVREEPRRVVYVEDRDHHHDDRDDHDHDKHHGKGHDKGRGKGHGKH